MTGTLPQRKPLRLNGYDYAHNGAYYITICTQNRECLFGEIIDGKMVLNKAGCLVEKALKITCQMRTDVSLDKYVIMPNHIHAIIYIGTQSGQIGTMQSSPTHHDLTVGADCIRPQTGPNDTHQTGTMQSSPPTHHDLTVGADCIRPKTGPNDTHQTGTMQSSRKVKSVLGHVVRGIKSNATSHINPDWIESRQSIWQRGYYDHIIRNEADLTRIREYILNNPAQWALDENNPIKTLNLNGTMQSSPTGGGVLC
jgi:putative transposase